MPEKSIDSVFPGPSGAVSGGGDGARSGDRGRGQEAGRVAPHHGAEEAVPDMETGHDVGWPQGGRQRGGLLRPERDVHGDGGEKEEQERRRRILDHHQASQRFLALSLSLLYHSLLCFPWCMYVKNGRRSVESMALLFLVAAAAAASPANLGLLRFICLVR